MLMLVLHMVKVIARASARAGCWLIDCFVMPLANAVSAANSFGRPAPRSGIVEKLFPLFGCMASQMVLRRLV